MARKTAPSKKQLIFSLVPKLVIGIVSIGLASAIGYLLSDRLTDLLYDALPGQLSLAVPNNNMILLACLAFGLVVSIPIIIWLTTTFVQANHHAESATQTAIAVLTSIGLLAVGLALAYYALLPAAFDTFIDLRKATGSNLAVSGSEYLGFVISYLIGFAVIFQVPVVLYILGQVKKVRLAAFVKIERYVVLVSFIVGGLLTPTTDVAHQASLAAPIIAIYQVGLGWAWLAKKRIRPVPSEIKVVPPFTLNIPDEVLLAEAGSKPTPATAPVAKVMAPKHVAAVAKAQPKQSSLAASKPTPRYQGVGYARQPISYQARPNRHLINDFIPN